MGSNAHPPHVHDGRTNRILMAAPVMCSLIALAIVVGNVAAGVPPQPDEGTSAHLFQLLIAVQFPLVIGFAATAEWNRPIRVFLGIVVQALAFSAALGALAWSGY